MSSGLQRELDRVGASVLQIGTANGRRVLYRRSLKPRECVTLTQRASPGQPSRREETDYGQDATVVVVAGR